MTALAEAPRRAHRPRHEDGLPRLLAGIAPGQPADLRHHERTYGPLDMPTAAWNGDRAAARRAAARLIDTIDRSGLTGRGGAGFPTGRKVRSVADGGRPAVVVANGAEGEPASKKDRLLLSRLPHLVLDGITLAAFAAGANEAYLAVHDGNARLMANLEGAIHARNVAGIDPVPIRLVGIDNCYVASEQTAIVQYINGGPGLPTYSPSRTHERGVDSRPTAVSNAETLAHLAMIGRYGDSWFRETGLPDEPGTMLVTVSGAIRRPGVYEVEVGTPIGEVLMRAGGPAERPQAILTGGYFGTWLPAEVAWQVPLARSSLRAAGGAMGAGVLVVLPQSCCGLAETARVVRYLADSGAGQCGPCIFGLPALADALEDLAYRGGRGNAAGRVAGLIPLIEGRGACRHPDGATQLAASAFRAFRHDVRWHDVDGPCFGVTEPPLLPIPGNAGSW
jgi:NADH:ubiquinone oxidoreductase subunit F (NADH-binding)